VPIEWSDRPGQQRARPPSPKLLRVRAAGRLGARLLGPAQRVLTHYVAEPLGDGKLVGRTYPCLGPTCRHCPAPETLREKAYAPAVWSSAGTPALVVLELTEAALDAIDDKTGGDPAAWRGLLVELYRASRAPNARVLVRFHERPPDYQLPEPFDVRPTLYHLWRYDPAADAAPAEPPKTLPIEPDKRKQA